MLIVLSKSDNVALWCNFQPTASTDLDIWTLKFANQWAIALKHSNVETIAVGIANENVSRITDVNTIWIVRNVLTTNAVQELSIFVENNNAVTLWEKIHNT